MVFVCGAVLAHATVDMLACIQRGMPRLDSLGLLTQRRLGLLMLDISSGKRGKAL
jgi:hypothetical protein